MATNVPVTLDTMIVVKLQLQPQGNTRRFKLPLRDLGANVFPDKLRQALELPADQDVVFERYSDSAGAYVTLDANKPQVYKTLFRAAKAKLKLRLRATVSGPDNEPAPTPEPEALPSPPISLQNAEIPSFPRVEEPTLTSPVIARTPLRDIAPATETTLEMAAQTSPVSPLVTKTADAGVKDEAPVPHAFTAPQCFYTGCAPVHNTGLAFRPKPEAQSWVVYCNNCNLPMEDEHYHCSICDHGDYDLCSLCVASGYHCPGSGHWMVKRFVKHGSVVNSTTERVGPKRKSTTEQEMPGAFTEEKQPEEKQPEEKQPVAEVVEKQEAEEPTRTCNCCVQVLHEREFVTCTGCEDYDLCMQCHIDNKHGHHPGHAFKAATEQTTMPVVADFLCNAGRNVRHSAVCDGCEKFIYGVRHKCLNCPDWDFCSECIKNAKSVHPAHRFVPIYEPLAEPVSSGNRHYGIYCDGPLCKDKENLSYIEGVRYKCAICNDVDFCANCEAHPSNRHNHTHPLIKFKRPVRSVSVTTLNEDKTGTSITRVGDRETTSRSASTETTPVSPSNAATLVQTIADVKPTEEPQPKTTKDKIEIRDLLAEPVQEKVAIAAAPSPVSAVSVNTKKPESAWNELDAHFVRDAIADGSKICAGFQFVQVWTLRNPGPNAWPAGCSVRHVGGDNMLDLDNTQPLSQSELAEASETNVIGRTVAAGEEVAFRIVLKAPLREGTAISYWRLKTANGTPFGHRLWCDIQVTSPPTPASAPAPVFEAEASSPSTTSRTTPYELAQQNAARLSKLQASREAEKSKVTGPFAKTHREYSARVQQDMERLRKLKLQMDEENQTRMLAKMDQERLARIQKVRKAAVERLMEVRRKQQEALNASREAAREPEKAVEAPVKTETAELPAEKEIIEKPAAAEPKPNASAMIFPQLEKESPASSTHEAVTAPSESPQPASVTTATVQSEDEFFEDAESVDIRSLSTDDGFMTDEEYDILDASDEDMP